MTRSEVRIATAEEYSQAFPEEAAKLALKPWVAFCNAGEFHEYFDTQAEAQSAASRHAAETGHGSGIYKR